MKILALFLFAVFCVFQQAEAADLSPFTGVTMLNNGLNSYSRSGVTVGPMWSRSGNLPGKPVTYEEAVVWINGLNKKNYGGFKDWRLPTIIELLFFADIAGKTPYVWFNVEGGFNNVQPYGYWSSSTNEGHSDFLLYVNMYNGSVEGVENRMKKTLMVWPVRSQD